MAQELHNLLDGLDIDAHEVHNDRVAGVEVKREKGWHRTAAYLLNTGKTQIEVAEALDKTPQMISILTSQPWFRTLQAQIVSNEGGNEVMEIMKNAAGGATLRLVELASGKFTYPPDENGRVLSVAVKPEIALASIKDILDRHLGKAPQHIDYTEKKPVGDPKEQYEELQRKLSELRPLTNTNN